ncbi:hypothetical protein KJ359_006248 [Pestalotiopsis sp. 9143b]|nr:hypothetical protein KJ359_006248 [Pestalotiopsis sp. 9143b]
MATLAPSSQETTLVNTSNNAQNLPRFSEFSAEIRLLIWKEVLREEQEDRAVIFDKHAMRILPTPGLVSPLLAACSESRHEALKVYTTCLDIYDMPLGLRIGGSYPKDDSIPNSMVRKHGRRSGKLRLSLSTDTFVMDGGLDAHFCLRRGMERRYHLWNDWQSWRHEYGPKYGYPYERAVSARLSDDQASQVRKTLWIIYACWWKVPGCLCPYGINKHKEDLESVIEILSGGRAPRGGSLNGLPTAILLFNNRQQWRVSELLFRLSGLPLRETISIDSFRATYLGTPQFLGVSRTWVENALFENIMEAYSSLL